MDLSDVVVDDIIADGMLKFLSDERFQNDSRNDQPRNKAEQIAIEGIILPEIRDYIIT